MRIGHGFDIHRFEDGKKLILGGVNIPHPQGMKAHSDGDVVLHALCDAMLGAAGLGDIGRHFSDKDPQFSNMDSRIFVQRTLEMLKIRHLAVGNIDITVIAEAPKLAAYIPKMQEIIAAIVGIDSTYVNIKATTMEQLGPIGQKQGIAAHAVVLLRNNNENISLQ